MGELIAGRYELEELVGTGGMSSVYRAHDRQLERNVALKVLHERLGADDEHVSRFRHEARAVAQLSHPNVVTVIDRFEEGGRQYIVFEYVDGENLKQLLDRTGPLPVRRALEIALAVADGLAYAHEHGVVHRDVKPQNVLLSRDGEIKVTDFGIARSLDGESGLTLTGTVLGTSSYLSPEQASGLRVTPAADVYSLGVVLYELLAGEVPFPGGNQVVVALKHVNEPPPSLLERRPDVPARLAAAVAMALQKDPEQRFASMAAFAAELRICLAEVESADTERTMVVPPPPPLRPGTGAACDTRRPEAAQADAAARGAARSRGRRGRRRRTRAHGERREPAGRVRRPGGSGAVSLRGVTGYDPDGTGPPGRAQRRRAAGDRRERGDVLGDRDIRLAGVRRTQVRRRTRARRGQLREARQPHGDDGHAGIHGEDPRRRRRVRTVRRRLVDRETVGASTTFALNGATARYYVVWITELPRATSPT